MNLKHVIGILLVIIVLATIYYLSPKANAPSSLNEVIPKETNTATENNDTVQSVADAQTTDTSPTTPTTETSGSAPASSPATSPAPAPAPTASPAPAPTPYDAIVVYDGTKFTPEKVTIPLGGTVRFFNSSAETKMWVTSDNHPTDSIYPIKSDSDCFGSSFNECEGATQNGYWDFTFTKLGSWGYHNHLQPTDTGHVNVVTQNDYLKAIKGGPTGQ